MFIALRLINNGTAWKPERAFTAEDHPDPEAFVKQLAERTPGVWLLLDGASVAEIRSDEEADDAW